MTDGADEAAGRGARAAVGTGVSVVAGLAAVLAVAHAGPGITGLAPVRRRLFPRLSGFGRTDHVALTFDDGPDPASTPAFLDLLAAHRLRATFFLLGSMVVKAPWLAADIVDAGHEVGVHGWDHKYTVLRTPRAVRDDLARAGEVVTSASGTQPRYYRPPFGVLSAGALAASRAEGLTPVLWTCWGKEWTAGATPDSVYATLAADLTPGGTVLLHDSDCTSPAGACAAALGALPRLFDLCAERGLRVGPLADHGLGR